MGSLDTSPRDVKAIVARYRAIGLFGGLLFGGVVGIIVAGPNFREWSGARSLLTIFGSLGVGGLVGYIAGEIAVASQASGGGSGFSGGSGESGGGGGGYDGGAGDSGGGGDS